MKTPYIFAKRFVAGESYDVAEKKVQRINQKRIRVTLDLLGENIKDATTAAETVDAYIELLEQIKASTLDSSISVKLTMMGLDISEEVCYANLSRLLDTAKAHNQFVRIDMEGSDYTQATIDLFKRALKTYQGHVGIVLQAYLHRTEKDVADLAALGADIRLCKGAYKEPANIALQSMDDIRAAYKEYAKVLIEKTAFPRMATHDGSLVTWLQEYATSEGLAKDRFEFQMLYGLREKTMNELSADGWKTCIYVPYGTMWFPYFTRRLMERKENVFFIATTLLKP
ncbi:MAG TPA: proline dehydrogenase [Bacteroidetes bacterium]|nr:MAG: proline dehydrogenase [Rhodothermaeota bacterium MED-G64]HBD42469.1 proline dehydrogenase [Bacteroidota bacterium]HBV99689.1 proline dehydrogenase [Bacteroidota bacterium]|tara:strand:- start:3529 stop:4380 length:852 start_codon:yes stop_codon:yes gene_type:complete